MEIYLTKTPHGHLMPATAQDMEKLKRFKMGAYLKVDLIKPRNPQFHRKYFALLNLGFEAWEPMPPEGSNIAPEKSFEAFRKLVTMGAGFGDTCYIQNQETGKNHSVTTPQSISFGSMPAEEFEQLYSNTIDFLLKYIRWGYKGRADIEAVLGFA